MLESIHHMTLELIKITFLLESNLLPKSLRNVT